MKTKPQPAQPDKAGASAALDESALEFLYKEYDALRDLFTQAENSAQNIFNFYLTLVTTVVGAIVLIVQVTPADPASIARSQFTVSGLLVFATGIGAAYLSSLTGRYAHLARYAQGIDELRRHLIGHLKVPLPPIYTRFMAAGDSPAPAAAGRRLPAWLYWLFPTGTYQLFVAVINSLSLAAGLWLFLSAAGVAQSELVRSLAAAAVVFVLSFETYNVYSHVVMQTLIRRLNVRVDSQRELPFIIGKM